MRLPSLRHKDKLDQVTEKSSSSPTSAPTPAATVTTSSDEVEESGHDSISLRIHNRTPVEFLTVSVFGALHTGNGTTQRIASSSIPSPPNPTSGGAAGAAGVFGVRNTPVRLPARGEVDVPAVRIQAFTAAATNGYSVTLTLNPRSANAARTGALSATLSAPPPTQLPVSSTARATSRLWKPLALTPTTTTAAPAKPVGMLSAATTSTNTQDVHDEIYALQSTDLATNTVHILLLPSINLSSWMSTLPSTDPLSSLCIPGTHESCALYGWPISACQETTSSIAVQLTRGIRFLDIRLALKGNPGQQLLYAYHGLTDEKMEFSAILSQVYAFLHSNPQETVLMSVKQENNMAGFLDSVNSYINKNHDKWWLGTGMPKLGDVRGKVVLISRFGSSDSQPGGIHPPIWPDSFPTLFDYSLPDGTTVWTQDWYNISTLSAIPTKLSLITKLVEKCGSDPTVLGFNFTNGSSFPLALPSWVAKGMGDQTKPNSCTGWWSNIGVNALLVDLVATRLKRDGEWGKRGGLMNVFAMDFFDQTNLGADLASLMVQANFV